MKGRAAVCMPPLKRSIAQAGRSKDPYLYERPLRRVRAQRAGRARHPGRLPPARRAAMKESKGKTKKAGAPKANASQPSQKGLTDSPAKPKK